MSIDRAVARAAAVAAVSVGRGFTDREIASMVERFGEHADGYLHARIVVKGQRYYFHRKYGSWLAPGQEGGRAVQKEPEGLLGSKLGSEIKYKLSELSRPYDTRKRQEREEASRARTQAAGGAGQRGVPSQAGGAGGVQAGGDPVGAAAEVSPD